MVAGAFGPWARVGDLATIHGTDGGRDGWVIVGAAAVAALAVLLYLRFRRSWLVVLSLLAASAGVVTTAYDINDLTGGASDSLLFEDISVDLGWGICVALLGSASLALASAGLLLESRRRVALREVQSGA
jgi:drug/metabolite transporter (DMT)-like permease